MVECGKLTWDINLISESLQLHPDDIKQYFTDGRRISFLIERRLCYLLDGSLSINEGCDYDLEGRGGLKWEVRSLSKTGIYFCPSYMVGSGRSFNSEGFENKLQKIDGYIISDIMKFPNIPYWIIPVDIVKTWWLTGQLGNTSKIGRKRFKLLLDDIS